jgi:3-oxoacyl-[acyl-carrier-protein] synthase II
VTVPICVTGMGACSALGPDLAAFSAGLAKGISGIQEHNGVFQEHPVWAGLVADGEAARGLEQPEFAQADRATHLAIRAAIEAWNNAFPPGFEPRRDRVALVMGTSHGGRSQFDAYVEQQNVTPSEQLARKVILEAPHHQQTEGVAYFLDIHGPVATVSSACSSSGAALAYAYELLQSGKADYVLAGGMDGFSKLTWAGFHALGAMASGPCGPFSSQIGISLGEGSAVVVLERLEQAQARNAVIQAELLGYGLSWDCYHITEPQPAGEGIRRAIDMATKMAGVCAEDIDYISLHGTGTRANDGAETLAVKGFFGSGKQAPPASAIKSFTGHTLGASAALAFIASITGMRDEFVPPTVNFIAPRPGCDLDYTPNSPRPRSIRNFCCHAAGFGGANTVLIGSCPGQTHSSHRIALHDVAITGMGVVSAIGLSLAEFQVALRRATCGIAAIERFSTSGCIASKAGLVRSFDPKRVLPALDLRRMDPGTQYAAVAAAEALSDAGLAPGSIPAERIGLIVGTTRGAATSFDRFVATVEGMQWHRASATHFPNMVMSSIGGHVSEALQLKGIGSTLVGGAGSGVHVMIHAIELLRRSEFQDALVVVVADEIAPLFFRLFDRLGMLSTAKGCRDESFRPYDPGASGPSLGEGAVAFVLEQLDHAVDRGGRVRAVARGSGMTADAGRLHGTEPTGSWLERAAQLALEEGRLCAEELDAVYGQGCGVPCRDHREVSALTRLLKGRPVPVTSVTGNTGLADSATGGFNIAAAILGMASDEVYPIVPGERLWPGLDFVRQSPRNGSYDNTLVMGSTENGNNAALILSRIRQTDGRQQAHLQES